MTRVWSAVVSGVAVVGRGADVTGSAGTVGVATAGVGDAVSAIVLVGVVGSGVVVACALASEAAPAKNPNPSMIAAETGSFCFPVDVRINRPIGDGYYIYREAKATSFSRYHAG